MKTTPITLSLLFLSLLSSCGLLEDTDLDPVYYLECEVDGTKYRAQTNQEAYMSWFSVIGGMYTITGQDVSQDFNVSLTLFGSLGDGKIATGINVNNLLTDIAYFTDNKTFTAVQHNGSGCVVLDVFTDDKAEGTFEATLKNLKDPSEVVEITNGKFKVKAR